MSRRNHSPHHDLLTLAAAVAALTVAATVAIAVAPTEDSAPTSGASTATTTVRLSGQPSSGTARPAPPEPPRAAPPTPADVDRTGKPSASAGPTTTAAALACIRAHESDTAGGYRAVNVSSGAAGAYQLMPALSDDWARRYGHPEWAGVTADQWPPAVQDSVAGQLYADWPGAWQGSGC